MTKRGYFAWFPVVGGVLAVLVAGCARETGVNSGESAKPVETAEFAATTGEAEGSGGVALVSRSPAPQLVDVNLEHASYEYFPRDDGGSAASNTSLHKSADGTWGVVSHLHSRRYHWEILWKRADNPQLGSGTITGVIVHVRTQQARPQPELTRLKVGAILKNASGAAFIGWTRATSAFARNGTELSLRATDSASPPRFKSPKFDGHNVELFGFAVELEEGGQATTAYDGRLVVVRCQVEKR
jgi:hypothetical protein